MISSKNLSSIFRNIKFTSKQRIAGIRAFSGADPLKAVLAEKITQRRHEIAEFRKAYKDVKICDVTVDQVFSGMRGLKTIIYETSLLDPNEGIRLRGFTIDEVRDKLPRFTYRDGSKSDEPCVESVFWLLCTGEMPSQEQVQWLSDEWAKYSTLPTSISKVIDTFPDSVHPMAQFSAAVSLLSYQSKFLAAQNMGTMKKLDQWKLVYDDVISLIAKLPAIASKIYRNVYHDGKVSLYNKQLDLSENFVRMMGFDSNEMADFMRLYLVIHSDHEGGNVSAHASRLVGSGQSDPFLSFASCLNGLAGPLHGKANQQVADWLDNLMNAIGTHPTTEQLSEYVHEFLKSGVVPGYGHAVLRKTDPRFTVQLNFAKKHKLNTPNVNLVAALYEIVPEILRAQGKAKNPYPNVDAISGSILEYFGLWERSFYTVPFGVSRCIGTSASLIWDRALGLPIERPKSLTSDALMELAKEKSQ